MAGARTGETSATMIWARGMIPCLVCCHLALGSGTPAVTLGCPEQEWPRHLLLVAVEWEWLGQSSLLLVGLGVAGRFPRAYTAELAKVILDWPCRSARRVSASCGRQCIFA